MLALLSEIVIDATFVSAPTVVALLAVTPETVAVKLLNLAVKALVYCAAVSAIAATVPVSVMLVNLVSAIKAARLVVIFAAVSLTVKPDILASAWAVAAMVAVTPETVAVKLLNLAVKALEYCAAVSVMADTVPDSVIPVSLVPNAINAVRFVVMFAALSVTEIEVTWVLATTVAVPPAVTALTARV